MTKTVAGPLLTVIWSRDLPRLPDAGQLRVDHFDSNLTTKITFNTSNVDKGVKPNRKF